MEYVTLSYIICTTLDSKKQILTGLVPMIKDAEKQRMLDVTECENFTRCRVNKAKQSRTGNYEYTDIDTELLVTTEEYERR